MPYWQFLIHIGLLSLAVHRVVAVVMLQHGDARIALVICYAAQAAFALWAALAMWMRLGAQVASIVMLASVVVITSAVQAFVLGAWAVPMSVGQAVIALVAGSGVVMALRYADAHPEGTPSTKSGKPGGV